MKFYTFVATRIYLSWNLLNQAWLPLHGYNPIAIVLSISKWIPIFRRDLLFGLIPCHPVGCTRMTQRTRSTLPSYSPWLFLLKLLGMTLYMIPSCLKYSCVWLIVSDDSIGLIVLEDSAHKAHPRISSTKQKFKPPNRTYLHHVLQPARPRLFRTKFQSCCWRAGTSAYWTCRSPTSFWAWPTLWSALCSLVAYHPGSRTLGQTGSQFLPLRSLAGTSFGSPCFFW